MRGSVKWQVREVFKHIEQIGASKHEAKAQARAAGARTWHQIGKSLGVHSYKTSQSYQKVGVQLLNHAKTQYGVKDIEKLCPEHIQSFLQSKIEQGCSKSTLKQYAAALEKLEVALNRYAQEKGTGNHYDFSQAISGIRDQIRDLPRSDLSRAYEKPQDLINALQRDEHRLAAQIQYESGARVRETSLIREHQLNPDRHSVTVQGKGGKVRELQLSERTFNELRGYIARHGEFRISYDQYRQDLREAAERTNQDCHGSHGLRWNYAQERMAELQEQGTPYEQALSEVAQEMGHERADITTGYLK